jgi:hypothetical protein
MGCAPRRRLGLAAATHRRLRACDRGRRCHSDRCTGKCETVLALQRFGLKQSRKLERFGCGRMVKTKVLRMVPKIRVGARDRRWPEGPHDNARTSLLSCVLHVLSTKGLVTTETCTHWKADHQITRATGSQREQDEESDRKP